MLFVCCSSCCLVLVVVVVLIIAINFGMSGESLTNSLAIFWHAMRCFNVRPLFLLLLFSFFLYSCFFYFSCSLLSRYLSLSAWHSLRVLLSYYAEREFLRLFLITFAAAERGRERVCVYVCVCLN